MAKTVFGTMIEAWRKRALLSYELDRLGQGASPRPEQRLAVFMGDNTVLARTKYGHKIFVDSRDMSLTPHIILDGDWEPWIGRAIAPHVAQGDIAVEVGANCGFYSVLLADWVGKSGSLHCFEANPGIFSFLKKNIEINGFFSKTKCYNYLVGDRNGTASFQIFRDHLGSSSMRDQSPIAELYSDSVQAVELPITTLDEMLKDVPHIDFLKVDAEGAESMILNGAKEIIARSPNLKMVLEFAPGNGFDSKDDARAYLQSFSESGFRTRVISQDSSIIEISTETLLESDYSELFIDRADR